MNGTLSRQGLSYLLTVESLKRSSAITGNGSGKYPNEKLTDYSEQTSKGDSNVRTRKGLSKNRENKMGGKSKGLQVKTNAFQMFIAANRALCLRILSVTFIWIALTAIELDCSYIETDNYQEPDPIVVVEFGNIYVLDIGWRIK